MVDRLIGVCGEFAAVEAESLVEVDAGAEREDPRGDACEETCGGAAAVAFEQELVFEGVDDRLDPLPDPADLGVGTVWLRMPASSWNFDGGLRVDGQTVTSSATS